MPHETCRRLVSLFYTRGANRGASSVEAGRTRPRGREILVRGGDSPCSRKGKGSYRAASTAVQRIHEAAAMRARRPTAANRDAFAEGEISCCEACRLGIGV